MICALRVPHTAAVMVVVMTYTILLPPWRHRQDRILQSPLQRIETFKHYVFKLRYIKCIIHWEIDYLLIDIFAFIIKPKKRMNKYNNIIF